MTLRHASPCHEQDQKIMKTLRRALRPVLAAAAVAAATLTACADTPPGAPTWTTAAGHLPRHKARTARRLLGPAPDHPVRRGERLNLPGSSGIRRTSSTATDLARDCRDARLTRLALDGAATPGQPDIRAAAFLVPLDISHHFETVGFQQIAILLAVQAAVIQRLSFEFPDRFPSVVPLVNISGAPGAARRAKVANRGRWSSGFR